MTHIIVIGNEKGGSGKTTTAMHLIVSLLNMGFRCASIDLDHRQQSLTHYVENRKSSCKKYGLDLKVPEHRTLQPSAEDSKEKSAAVDEMKLQKIVDDLAPQNDFIILDTPGSDTALSRKAHSIANTLITPINDSFVDLDLIGNLDAKDLGTKRPGIYSAMFWDQKMKRIRDSQEEIRWFVVRNRLSSLDAHNKRKMADALEKLSKKFGFKVSPGFGDRVIFKELFLEGFTLHDAGKTESVRISPSMIAARLELARFINSLEIPSIMAKEKGSIPA